MRATRWTREALTVLLLCLAPSAENVSAQAVLRPVAKELLPSALILRSMAENFSITAPGEGWEWLQSDPPEGGGSTYVCRERRTDARLILVVLPPHPGAPPTFDEFLQACRQGLAKPGMGEPKVTASNVPLPGSVRFITRRKRPEGIEYLQGYAHMAGRRYNFMTFTESPAEPESLGRLVKSFRLLSTPRAASSAQGSKSEPPGPTGPGIRAPLGLVHVLLLACIWGFGRFVNVVLGRPAVNGALVALATILLLALGAGLRGLTDPRHSTEVMAVRLGEALIPLAIAAWGASRFSKKKQQASTQAS